jgi:hypothetical protein
MSDPTGSAGRGRLAEVLATRGGRAEPEAPFVIEHREALIYMLCAIGAAPHLTRPNLPAPARHYPAGVNLTLVPFGAHGFLWPRPASDLGSGQGSGQGSSRARGAGRSGDGGGAGTEPVGRRDVTMCFVHSGSGGPVQRAAVGEAAAGLAR